MNYRQEYIDSIGEEWFRKVLDGKINYNFDIDNINSKEQQRYFSFQHYLIKAYITGYNRTSCIRYIKKIYHDFVNKPYLFCDSPLLSSQVIKLFFGNSEAKDKILDWRNRYYSKEKIAELRNKRKSLVGLTDEEKKRYFSYLLLQLRENNSKENEEIFKDEIKRILNTRMEKLSDIELKFYAQYVSEFLTKQKPKTVVMIGTDVPTLYGYQNKGYIFINKKAFNSLALLTETVCHESRHSVQLNQSLTDNTKAGFTAAQFDLFIRYLNTQEYDSYHSNYRYSPIELDAEREGHFQASVFLGMFNKKDFVQEIKDNRKKTFDNRDYYNYMKDKSGMKLTIDKFIVTNLDNIIKNNPFELKTYPILRNIYNQDGTKKSFSTIIKGRLDDAKLLDKRDTYYPYINYGIQNGELSSISLDDFDMSQKEHFFRVLLKLCGNYSGELKKYCKDEGNNTNPKQIVFATEYRLKLCYKLLSYIDDNYDRIIKVIGFHFVRDFTYDFRDFDINSIKNKVIRNNPDIISKIAKVKQKNDSIIRKYNASYIDEKLSEIPAKLKEAYIIIDGKSVMFEKAFKDIIVPRMDGHQNIRIDGQTIRVSNLIDIYLQQSKRSLLSSETHKPKSL